jgi:hypothetical protein
MFLLSAKTESENRRTRWFALPMLQGDRAAGNGAAGVREKEIDLNRILVYSMP